MRVPVSKMWELIEAIIQASLKTVQDHDGRPFPTYPVYPSGKTWYEASGKKGSMKKFYRNIISEADCAAQPYHVATITPVTHYCMAVWIGWSSVVWQDRFRKEVSPQRHSGNRFQQLMDNAFTPRVRRPVTATPHPLSQLETGVIMSGVTAT